MRSEDTAMTSNFFDLFRCGHESLWTRNVLFDVNTSFFVNDFHLVTFRDPIVPDRIVYSVQQQNPKADSAGLDENERNRIAGRSNAELSG